MEEAKGLRITRWGNQSRDKVVQLFIAQAEYDRLKAIADLTGTTPSGVANALIYGLANLEADCTKLLVESYKERYLRASKKNNTPLMRMLQVVNMARENEQLFDEVAEHWEEIRKIEADTDLLIDAICLLSRKYPVEGFTLTQCINKALMEERHRRYQCRKYKTVTQEDLLDIFSEDSRKVCELLGVERNRNDEN